MSSPTVLPADFVRRAQDRVLNLYAATILLMLVTIAILVVYCLRLGPLIGVGVERSFGIAAGLLFLCAALIAHVVDRTYRVWPEGRSFRPSFPGFFTERGYANAAKILVLVAAAIAIGYIIATLLT